MWDIIGHGPSIDLLNSGLASKRLAHSYIFSGPSYVGKKTTAIKLAQAVNCIGEAPPCGQCHQCESIARQIHADVMLLQVQEEDGHKSIPLDAIKAIQPLAFLKPYTGTCRVFIIDGAEFLTVQAANALLKILEEPPADTLFLLLALDTKRVMPTVLSRCQLLNFRPLPTSEIIHALTVKWKVPVELATKLAHAARGRPGWAIKGWEDPEFFNGYLMQLDRFTELAIAPLEGRLDYVAKLASIYPQQRTVVTETLYLWSKWWGDLLIHAFREQNPVQDSLMIEHKEGDQSGISLDEIARVAQCILSTVDLLQINVNPHLALQEMVLSMPTMAKHHPDPKDPR